MTGVPFDCLHWDCNVRNFFCSCGILLTSNMTLIINTSSWKLLAFACVLWGNHLRLRDQSCSVSFLRLELCGPLRWEATGCSLLRKISLWKLSPEWVWVSQCLCTLMVCLAVRTILSPQGSDSTGHRYCEGPISSLTSVPVCPGCWKEHLFLSVLKGGRGGPVKVLADPGPGEDLVLVHEWQFLAVTSRGRSCLGNFLRLI